MEFEAVIGLEIHAQMSTKTKMFCRCDNDSFDKAPNINTCPICMGFPGQLPNFNKETIVKGVKAALALGCKINHFSKFDRSRPRLKRYHSGKAGFGSCSVSHHINFGRE